MTELSRATYFAADAEYTRFNSKRSLRTDPTHLEIRQFGASWAVRDAARPEPYYNRVFGLGDNHELSAATEWVGEHCDRVRVDTICEPNESSDEIVLLHPQPPAPGVDAEFRIRRAELTDLECVFDLWASDGDAIPAAARAAGRAAQMDPRFPIHVATSDDERIIAMATTFYAHGVAWLGNANTHSEFRRKGAHRSLLRARCELAIQRGARWVITDTTPGSGSHRSSLKSGFHPLFGIRYEWRTP